MFVCFFVCVFVCVLCHVLYILLCLFCCVRTAESIKTTMTRSYENLKSVLFRNEKFDAKIN